MEFDWQESQDKKKHFYVYAGYCNDRLGFVSYRQNGWKAKSYMPGAWHRVCGDLDEAKAFVEDQIKAFLDAVSAQGENWITRTRYLEATGCEPTHDDIERANCPEAGRLGHFACGWNHAMNLPYTMVPRTPI